MFRWLSELNDKDSADVGPKIARLGTLRASGIEVPDGFAITTAAFERFLTEDGLGLKIERELAEVSDIENLAATEAASVRIRHLIEQAPIGCAFEGALRDAYDELCFRHGDVGLPVAVRSSAAGEDAATASFAGQYESYLGVIGAEAVVAAVRRAWSSLFVTRALAYRARQKQHFRQTPMGVGVLRLVHARCAGVAFSAHPVNGKRDRFVIEASWGWGESVVQGTVEPDSVEVDRNDGHTLSYRIGDKRVASLFDPARGGVTEQPLPERFQRSPCLTPEMIRALWKTISDIERQFGKPVDIEWVIEPAWRAGAPISIVQVRPITTLDAEAEPPPAKWDALQYAAKYGLGIKATPGVSRR
jgi:phosphoenolpyruvate synthase/pyruvate phosphate dikinase